MHFSSSLSYEIDSIFSWTFSLPRNVTYLIIFAPHLGQVIWLQGIPLLWGAFVPHSGQTHCPLGPKP